MWSWCADLVLDQRPYPLTKEILIEWLRLIALWVASSADTCVPTDDLLPVAAKHSTTETPTPEFHIQNIDPLFFQRGSSLLLLDNRALPQQNQHAQFLYHEFCKSVPLYLPSVFLFNQ